MTGSQRQTTDHKAASPDAAPERLTRRAEFLRVAQGRRQHARLVGLQANPRGEDAAGPARFGLTVTKKTGCAVVRNRIRRRLRAALAALPAPRGRDGCDYVIVARAELVRAPFDEIKAEIAGALRRIHDGRPRRAPAQGQRGAAAAATQTKDRADS